MAIEWLVKLFNEVWGRGVAPRDWKSAIIVPIHKKGSRLECTNYRGISFLSVVGKVFARVLNDRVKGLTLLCLSRSIWDRCCIILLCLHFNGQNLY